MSINMIRTSDGDITRVPLTSATGGFAYCKLVHEVAVATMNGGNVDVVDDLWQNPETVPILVFRFVVNETTPASGGGSTGESVTVGTAVNGTTASLNLIDAFDADLIGWYDNVYGPAGFGGTATIAIQYMDANGGTTDHITCQYKTNDCSALRATCYIFYVPLR